MDVEKLGERPIKPPARALTMARNDNVALVLRDVKAGEAVVLVGGQVAIAAEDIPTGYKIATQILIVGQAVIAQGQIIGTAARLIQPGEHVHHHNLRAA